MGLLSNNINTIPNVQNYKEGEEEPNSVPFVVCACEGDEECDYLSIFKRSHRLEIVNDYYNNDQEKKGHSHPQKRIDALIEFLGEESLDLDIKGFSNKIDKAFLVVDRDAQSFKENQYDCIKEICAKKNVEFIISNPSFQLWLLLHFFSDIESLNLEKETRTKKQIKKIEDEIKKYVKNYKHGTINVGSFSKHVNTALDNAKQFDALTVDDLKDKIGTRFSVLVKYLLGN